MLALDALGAADTVVLVARGTHLRRDLGSLFEALGRLSQVSQVSPREVQSLQSQRVREDECLTFRRSKRVCAIFEHTLT